MQFYYHDIFTFPLPTDHRFPINKYQQLREKLDKSKLISSQDMYLADPATDEQLLLVHTPKYINKITQGALTDKDIRQVGLPWSPDLLKRSRHSVGSTIGASRAALKDGIAASLAGGTHHSFADHGEGYCVFNDIMIAIRVLQKEGLIKTAVVLDTDVHQGNGTAHIAKDDPSVFTFSIHGEKNFPFRKQASDLDIGLPDGAEDEEFIAALKDGLEQVFAQTQPDIAFYLAGADPFIGDRLGRLNLTKEGLAQRDQMVFETCRSQNIPVVITMSGGYASDIKDTVDIHFQTIRGALGRLRKE